MSNKFPSNAEAAGPGTTLRDNVLGFPRCFGIKEEAKRDLFLAVIPRVALGFRYVLSSYNVSNTMLDTKGNLLKETDISASCSRQRACEAELRSAG